MDEMIDSYFALKKKIHEGFGYVEDWVMIPLDDMRSAHWVLSGGEESGKVFWAYKPFEEIDIGKGSELYDAVIYTQRHLPKWVYRTETHVLICVDTQCDLNRALFIFDAAKECKNEKVIRELRECW